MSNALLIFKDIECTIARYSWNNSHIAGKRTQGELEIA